MRIQIVDPPAFTPPYDHALCAALADAGADVELVTSHFAYGSVPRPDGYLVRELFYRHARGLPGSHARRASKLAEHLPDMLRYRKVAAAADLVHFQWFDVPWVDARVLPRRPLVITAHDLLPREPRPGQARAQRRLYDAADAVVVHSAYGRRRLVDGLSIDPAKVRVIHHGAFDYLARLPDPDPLPDELTHVDVPVVLFFGLLRPYKGIDTLLAAWRGIDNAELWIVGRPMMALEPLRAAAGATVRFVPRFVSDAELASFFRRADVVVLPYSRTERFDQSGVLATALAFAKPVVVSDIGGFGEVAELGRGAARAAGRSRSSPPGPRSDPRRSRRARAPCRGRPRRRRGPVLVGRRGSRDARALPGARRVTAPPAPQSAAVTALAIVFWVSVGLLAYTHVGYPLLLALLARARRGRGRGASVAAGTTELPSVSLIVAAYAEQEVIAERVANLRALDYPADLLELIVACDGSPDATPRRARDAGADLVLELPRGGKIRAQDAAVDRARGAIVAFSDANASWDPQALRRLVAPFEANPRVGYVCGEVRFVNDRGTNQEGLYWRYEMALRALESRVRSVTGGNGAIYATRRESYLVVDPIMGHDLSFPFNMVKRGWIAPYVAGRPCEREDGADDRGRVRTQATDDEPRLADRGARRHALAARLRPAVRADDLLPPHPPLPLAVPALGGARGEHRAARRRVGVRRRRRHAGRRAARGRCSRRCCPPARCSSRATTC